MSRRSSLPSSSQPASGSTSLSSNPNQTPETPPPVNGRPGQSNGHRSSGSQSGFKGNDDVEKQLSGAVQASTLDSEVGSTRLDPVQGNHGPTGKTQDHPIPSDPLTAMPSKLDQYNDFWNAYNKEADKEDSELIKSLEDDLNTLLIFAGLFSATNTAFIIESYRDLKQDQSELTNNLLRNMMRTMHQSSFKEADLLLDYGGPSGRAIVVNLFFFASLCCSLFTAFGAVIAKQWLDHYGREIHISSPSARGMERQQKYVGLRKWKFQAVVETFPTLLQFSLFFFFIGLIEFLWQLNKGVTILVIVFSVVTTLLYVITHFIGILYPKSPFQTRLTTVLRNRLFRVKMPTAIEDQKRKMDLLQAQSVDWLHERTTNTDTVGIISRAILLLTDAAKKAINLDHGGKMLAYLLRSSLYNGRVYLGISLEGLQSSLVVFHDLIAQWDKEKDIVHPSDEGNASFLQALSRELWKLLLNPEKMDKTAASTALAILEKLGPIKEDSVSIHGEYLVDSLSKQCDRKDQLLQLALLHDTVRSQDHLFLRNYTASRHMPEVLATTMWGMDKEPDLDHRRVALRLAWFLRETDEMYPQIQYLDFGRYLSLWRKSQVQPDHSIPSRAVALDNLYLRTLIRLLFHDQEKWAKELEEHGHFTQIEALIRNRSASLDAQPLCWTAFILFAHSPGRSGDPTVAPSHYYSEKLVELVISQLNPNRLPWTTLSREAWYKPTHTAMLMQSLYGYMQMAYNYGRIEEGKVAEIFTVINKESWDLLLHGTPDEIATSITFKTLEKLGPINRGATRDSRITYLNESLGKQVTRENQLLLLALLHDSRDICLKY
ncbi:hypothetical protein FRC02_004016 [Tulasnella sp. 418]|nr:hypothetical protein FRC02_004016 [Tulasnella sp. 418]